MAVTVKELIAELKKFPQNGLVGFRDHDQLENEISALVSSVSPFDQQSSFDPQFTKGVVVVFSP